MHIENLVIGGSARGLPTAIAVPLSSDAAPKFGDDAFSAGKDFILLTNWKLLLGRTETQIIKEREQNDALDRALQKESLEGVTRQYIGYLLGLVQNSATLSTLPEFVIGVPSTTAENVAARNRYRKIIEKVFRDLAAPRPRFFPEPFAVFQYHFSRGDIEDLGRPQNVLVLDIGGGTTNVCTIQTSHHGRLARHGENHKPHGVETLEIGGSNIDRLILDKVVRSTRIRDPRATLLAREFKERISKKLTSRDCWRDRNSAQEIREVISLEGQGDWPFTGADLIDIVESRFWPQVKTTIQESLAALPDARTDAPLEKIDAVIMAGGTCQIGLLQILFDRDFGSKPMFSQYKLVLSPEFEKAVAGGLAFEACANSRLHQMRPARIAPYLQSNLYFEVGHSQASVDAPARLRLLSGPSGATPHGNPILRAPMPVSDLNGQVLEWQFTLRQQPDRICLRLSQEEDAFQRSLSDLTTVKLSRKDTAGARCKLRLLINDDGVADVGILAWNNNERAEVHYPAGRLDFHELREMEGEAFFGLDFGTTNSFVAKATADSGATEALPEQYFIDEATMARARNLPSSFDQLSNTAGCTRAALEEYENEILKDYVYHSNRIEGSVLSRGQTKMLLRDFPEEGSTHIRDIRAEVERFAFIDEAGNIQRAARPVKDEVAAVNLRDAFLEMRDLAKSDRELTLFHLRSLHGLVTRGDPNARPGDLRRESIKISHTTFVPPEAAQVEPLLREMCSYFSSKAFMSFPPIYQATYAHARFVSIHPFHDGNGRLARLVANFFLWRHGLPSVMLPWENRNRYYDALEECNTPERSTRGDLTDLSMLFCDLADDALENLKRISARPTTSSIPAMISDEPVISTGSPNSPRLNRLLASIGAGKRAIDLAAQYESWCASFTTLAADVREEVLLVDSAYRDRWGGSVGLREFPIIDLDTYNAIREGRLYSRTWFMQLRIGCLGKNEDVVFFFGRPSPRAVHVDEGLIRSASLGISRLEKAKGRHVNVYNGEWCRVREIAHNGSTMAMVMQEEDRFTVTLASDPTFKDWFAILMEDVTQNLLGHELTTP